MLTPLRSALAGDYGASVAAHQAIPPALALAVASLDRTIEPHWLPTDAIE